MLTRTRTIIACAVAITAALLALAGAGAPAAAAAPGRPAMLTTAGRHHGNAASTATQEVLAYGHQVTGNGIDPKHDTFAIFATGTGLSAAGTFSVWLYSTCATGPCKFRWTTEKVTCVQDLSANHVVVTGTTTYLGVKETLVADAVDNSNPSSSANPDGIRFTTYANGGAGGCASPSPQGPNNILSVDIQVQNPPAPVLGSSGPAAR
jgi:hypothetical protein